MNSWSVPQAFQRPNLPLKFSKRYSTHRFGQAWRLLSGLHKVLPLLIAYLRVELISKPYCTKQCRLCETSLMSTNDIDKHGRTVHHGNTHSTHSRLTQTTPFANRPTTLCWRLLYPPKLPCHLALLHQLCQLSTKDQPTYQLLFHPCLFASDQQLTNVAQAHPAFTMSNPAIKLAEPVCLWSRAMLPRKTLHVDCLPLCHFILNLVC
jgi:hypothetical protein